MNYSEGIGCPKTRQGRPTPRKTALIRGCRYPPGSISEFDNSEAFDRCLSIIGFRSVRQLCRACGANEGLVGKWRKGEPCSGSDAPLIKHGLNGVLRKLVDFTGFLEWEMFPGYFTERFYNNTLSWGEVAMRSGGLCRSYIPRGIIRRILCTIPPNVAEILRMRFGLEGRREYTLREASLVLGLTRERVRQIEMKGLRYLRHPRYMRMLREIMDYCYDPDNLTPFVEHMRKQVLNMTKRGVIR